MAARESTTSGNWSDTGTWKDGNKPGASDTWTIKAGHTVVLDEEVAAVGAGIIENTGRLTIAIQMATSAFAAITVNSGGSIYASRSVSSLLRLAGLLTLSGPKGLNYGESTDQISNPAVGAFIEIVSASDFQSSRYIQANYTGAVTFYGAALMLESTLAQQETSSPENNDLVLTDDMALRPGALAGVTNGTVDMICLGQNAILTAGSGSKFLQTELFLVAGYDAKTKTVTLGDAGAGVAASWPRGGTAGNGYDDVKTTRAAGTPVYRVSFNVGLRGSAYNLKPYYGITGSSYTQNLFYNCSFWWTAYPLNSGAVTVPGTITACGCSYVVSSPVAEVSGTAVFCGNATIGTGTTNYSGNITIIGNDSGIIGTSNTLSGTIKCYGNTYGIYNGSYNNITGNVTFAGNGYGLNSSSGIHTGTITFYANNVAINGGQNVLTGTSTFTRNGTGIGSSFVVMSGTNSFSESSTVDMTSLVYGSKLYNVSLGSTNKYSITAFVPDYHYIVSRDQDGVTGNTYVYCQGGTAYYTTATYPTNKTWSIRHACNSATKPVFYEERYMLNPNEVLNINIWMYKDASMSYLPWAAIVDPESTDKLYVDSLVPASIYTMANNTDWQTSSLTYTNSTTKIKEVILRSVAKNATGNMYFYYERVISAGGGLMGSGGMGGGFQ